MLTSLNIAWRFLRNNKTQTLIIVIGISIAVSVQIFIGLLSRGLEKTMLNKVIGNSAHITISSQKGGIDAWNDKKNIVLKMQGIKAVVPVVDYYAYFKLNDIMETIQIRGFENNDADSIYKIRSAIYEGRMVENDGEALLGKDLKERTGLKVGDKISIVTIDNKKSDITIVGFYDLGVSKINKLWAITNLKTAQNLNGFGDKVTSIEIGINDVYNADNLSKKIENRFSDNTLKIENWKDQNKLLASGIEGQKICAVIIEVFVLFVAVLSIISILSISVMQKYKQIGILKAMGTKNFSASAIFFFEAFTIGILGTILGIGFTFLDIKYFNKYIITSDGSPVVNIIINRRFIAESSLADVTASTLAAFFPAVKCFSLNPVEIIKNE